MGSDNANKNKMHFYLKIILRKSKRMINVLLQVAGVIIFMLVSLAFLYLMTELLSPYMVID